MTFSTTFHITLQHQSAATRNFVGVFSSLNRLHLAKKKKQIEHTPEIARMSFSTTFHITLQPQNVASPNFVGVFRSLNRLHSAKKNQRTRLENALEIVIMIF